MFYDKFIDLCKNAGVTPTQVARDIGIRQSTVSMWKQQGTTPRYETLQKLADYFAVPINELTKTQISTHGMENAMRKILESSIVDADQKPQKAMLRPIGAASEKPSNYNIPVSFDALKIALDYEQLDEAGKKAIRNAIDTELARFIDK